MTYGNQTGALILYCELSDENMNQADCNDPWLLGYYCELFLIDDRQTWPTICLVKIVIHWTIPKGKFLCKIVDSDNALLFVHNSTRHWWFYTNFIKVLFANLYMDIKLVWIDWLLRIKLISSKHKLIIIFHVH